ncbi:hypothetical protein [Saccharomonospora piscinae]|uniref:hypothetical protein n=1 Tax=Saccharomonospora piscinae TaxID=687388 RepID=UPI000463BD3E|nr:hypothetical protein [Saccharomonospora piscinae]
MRPERYRGWHRPMLVCAGVMTVLAAGSAVGLALDDRTITGAPAWLKPFKFAVSIAAYSLTWAWLVSLLRTRLRLAHRISTAIVAVFGVEYAIIVVQVIRGTSSHFNVSTPLNSTLFAVMGISIAAVWTGTLVLTVLLLRTPIADPAARWAVRLGTLISLAGLALGGLMTNPTESQQRTLDTGGFEGVIGAHSVGVPDGGAGMPITGWSTTGGDLRIPHFVGMHALQALPLLVMAIGLAARRWPRLRDDVVRTRLVLVGGAAYAGVVALVTWQALRGQPLVRPDTLTWAAVAALGAICAAGTAWALRHRATAPGHPEPGDARELAATDAGRG